MGDIPIEVQPKLLRALQEREFERLGGTKTRKANVRLIAATNRDLEKMVARGEFRSDLYYRLNVFPILLPPLRSRREDIPALIEHFVDKYSRKLRKHIERVPEETMSALISYPWPGNVRELQNLIERAVILCRNGVLPSPLPEESSETVITGSGSNALENVNRTLLLHALEEADWRLGGPQGAATKLGLKRTTLIYKLKKLGISRPMRRSRTTMQQNRPSASTQ